MKYNIVRFKWDIRETQKDVFKIKAPGYIFNDPEQTDTRRESNYLHFQFSDRKRTRNKNMKRERICVLITKKKKN